VVQPAEHRLGDDTVAFADPMAIRTDADACIGRLGNARPKTGVRPPPIVQLDNATPIVLSFDKSVIGGIHGSAGPSRSTRR